MVPLRELGNLERRGHPADADRDDAQSYLRIIGLRIMLMLRKKNCPTSYFP